MNKKLYVGNLAFTVTADALRDLFAEVGEVVSSTVISDRYSNRSKGFGFVEMATEQQAEEAINQLDGKELEGREIKVAEARPPRRDRDRQSRRDDRW